VFNRRLLVSTSGGGSDPVPELPDQDTLLLDGFGPGTVTIKIPEGCNVVKVFTMFTTNRKDLYKLTSIRLKLAFGGWKHTDTKGLVAIFISA
jgi:hypothetical protein